MSVSSEDSVFTAVIFGLLITVILSIVLLFVVAPIVYILVCWGTDYMVSDLDRSFLEYVFGDYSYESFVFLTILVFALTISTGYSLSKIIFQKIYSQTKKRHRDGFDHSLALTFVFMNSPAIILEKSLYLFYFPKHIHFSGLISYLTYGFILGVSIRLLLMVKDKLKTSRRTRIIYKEDEGIWIIE